MKVAAYQAPLPQDDLEAAIAEIAQRVRICEAEGVEILCCPEAVLGGLADDYAAHESIALPVERLETVLRRLASSAVTSIIGFTERAEDGRLFNSAAIFASGVVVGVYRKRHPARRASVYAAGAESSVFSVGSRRFGVLICNDSNHFGLAEDMVSRGASMLVIPSNNALRYDRAEVAEETRAVDVALARRLGVPVIRADVAGRSERRLAVGTSAIIAADGAIVKTGVRETPGLLVAEV